MLQHGRVEPGRARVGPRAEPGARHLPGQLLEVVQADRDPLAVDQVLERGGLGRDVRQAPVDLARVLAGQFGDAADVGLDVRLVADDADVGVALAVLLAVQRVADRGAPGAAPGPARGAAAGVEALEVLERLVVADRDGDRQVGEEVGLLLLDRRVDRLAEGDQVGGARVEGEVDPDRPGVAELVERAAELLAGVQLLDGAAGDETAAEEGCPGGDGYPCADGAADGGVDGLAPATGDGSGPVGPAAEASSAQ
ncbi:hypothetical protein Kpho02_68550 [Kitasatospora phosalacinea]|uniref:Uncharacterized protein n=1 Tax=Kitasatospora phosalacinea TaxID=2065 RepID=A0A9W6QD13_9ACTN|nr:hypothetical protein [Kitasatospora phosalacinea]GLW74557.1 hypothetical protein Kpho02_68550 [Kitasatospora phosalacinea]